MFLSALEMNHTWQYIFKLCESYGKIDLERRIVYGVSLDKGCGYSTVSVSCRRQKHHVLIIGGGRFGVLCAQHDVLYSDLMKSFDALTAKRYLAANLCAVEQFRALSQSVPCHFEDKPSIMYSLTDKAKMKRVPVRSSIPRWHNFIRSNFSPEFPRTLTFLKIRFCTTLRGLSRTKLKAKYWLKGSSWLPISHF